MWPFRKKAEPDDPPIDMLPFAEFMLAQAERARQDFVFVPATIEEIHQRFWWSSVRTPEADPYTWRDPAELWPEV